MERHRDMEQRRRDMIPLVCSRSLIALSQERGTSSARRQWMEYERQLRDRDSDSEEGAVHNPQNVDWPRRQLRTDIDYDQLSCYAGYNLRCVKWGPEAAHGNIIGRPWLHKDRPTKTCATVSAVAGCATRGLSSTKGRGLAPAGKDKLAGPGFRVRMNF